ncbi:MAG: hypothetical protein FWC70_01790, partial [Defluviitaleaceae bacterium]|nr:hypothetical protein [Defluviitaleaceae bacterium]
MGASAHFPTKFEATQNQVATRNCSVIVKQYKNALVSPPTTRTFVANALEKSVQVSSENAQKPAISRLAFT